MYERPAYHDQNPIDGFWDGQPYLSMQAKPLYNLTWTFLYRLLRLKLLSPRSKKFKLMIADYGFDT